MNFGLETLEIRFFEFKTAFTFQPKRRQTCNLLVLLRVHPNMKFAFTLLVIPLSLFAQTVEIETEPMPPNILLIIIDDISQQDLSIYNQQTSASLPYTPVIETLAGSSVIFNNAYAYPTCSPTRASIITGRYGFRTGIGTVFGSDSSISQLPTSETTLPEIFATHNPSYQLAQFGKWHLGRSANSPSEIGGWPHFSGSLSGGVSDFYDWTKYTNGASIQITNYATSENVNDFLAWYQTLDQSMPWFSWIAFNAPHAPLHIPPEGLHYKQNLDPDPAAIETDPRPYFEASVEAFDTEFGRLLASIDLTNTVIILIGDNGTANAAKQEYLEQGKNKGSLYEGGIKIPMLIVDPSKVIPSAVNNPVHVVDLFSTILDYAEIDYVPPANQSIDSKSLVDKMAPITTVISTESSNPILYAEAFNGENPNAGGSVARNERYKLILFHNGTSEFYDLITDPLENNNLLELEILTEAQSAALQELQEYLNSIQ